MKGTKHGRNFRKKMEYEPLLRSNPRSKWIEIELHFIWHHLLKKPSIDKRWVKDTGGCIWLKTSSSSHQDFNHTRILEWIGWKFYYAVFLSNIVYSLPLRVYDLHSFPHLWMMTLNNKNCKNSLMSKVQIKLEKEKKKKTMPFIIWSSFLDSKVKTK